MDKFLTSIGRLQFRHNDTVFSSNTEAIRQFLVHGDDGDMRLKSLKGEPTVLLYGNEGNPHVILAIGAVDNSTSFGVSNRYCFIDVHDIKKHIAAHYKEFKDTVVRLSAVALKSDTLNLYAEQTADGTLLSGDVKTAYSHTDTNTDKVYFNNLINLKSDDPSQKGLFMYVNLDWDARENKFVFKVSKPDGTIESTDFPIPNKYIESGYYDIKDEKIVLRYNDDSEPIKIDCKYLISEWVADEGETTPIILKKEVVKYKDDDIHRLEPWQDILHADVRIKDELFDENGNAYKVDGSTNILERTYEGRALYVDGSASNIIYYKDGENITVQGALDELINTKPSSDSRNIIVKKPDGFFADVRLRYDKGKNKLTLIVSSLDDQGNITTKETPIELAVANFLDQVWYDSAREEIVIAYTDGTSTKQYTRVPVAGLIEEWAVYNEYHSVKLVKVRNSGSGPDLLSADVKITKTARNNILEDRNHELYVRGEANNIKYDATGDTTVKDVLDNLSANTIFLSGAIDSVSAIVDTNIERIDNTIGTGFTDDPHDNITFKFEALSAKTDAEIERSEAKDQEHDDRLDEIDGRLDDHDAKIEAVSANALSKIIDIASENKSLTVIKSGDTDPTVDLKVNIYPNSGNTIAHLMSEGGNGLFNYVDLTYDSSANTLTFVKSKSDGSLTSNTIQLDSISFIDEIYYDPTDETLVVVYWSGHERKEMRIPLRTLINEWDVDNTKNVAIALTKTLNEGNGPDILTASAKVASDADNILVIKEGELYVSRSGITALEDRMDDAEDRLDNVEANINTISGDLQTEITERTNEIERIDITIGSGFSTDAHETITYRFEQLTNDLQSEVDRATSEEQRIEEKLDHEVERSTSADTIHDERLDVIEAKIGTGFTDDPHDNITFKFEALSGKLDTEIHDRITADTRLEDDLQSEVDRATSEEQRIEEKLDHEIDRSTSADSVHDSAITTINSTIGSGFSTDAHETITYRFEQVTNDLQSEVDRATSEEQRIEGKLDREIERSMSADSVHDNAITTINNTIGTGFTSSADSNITFKFDTLTRNLNDEIQRSTDEDARILGLIDRERARAESAETALDDKIDNITLTFEDTPSIDFNNPYNEGNVVKANLKLDTNPRGNILYIDSAGGVGASVALSYDSGRNELKFEKTNSSGDTDVNLITLNAGSIINSITYDDVTKELIILYEDAAGVEHETRVDVSSLFNEWTPVTDHLGAILLTKTQHTGTHGADELRAEAVISTLPTNILINDQGSLYVDGSPISAATELGECVKAELKTIEKVLIGETIQDCSTSYTYHNHSAAHYIHSATSFDDADVILDQIAYNLDIAIQNLANPEDTPTVHMYNDNGRLKSDVIQSTQHGTTTSTTYGVNMVELLNDGVYVNGTIDCGEFDGNVEPIDYSNHGRNVNA